MILKWNNKSGGEHGWADAAERRTFQRGLIRRQQHVRDSEILKAFHFASFRPKS